MATYVLLNAESGQGAAARRWSRLERTARAIFPDLTVITGSRSEELQSAARQIATDGTPSTIIAAGGDGTSHLVVNALLDAEPGHQTAMAWLPIGSGNDLARAIGIPLRLPDCLHAYQDRHRATIDAGRVEYTGLNGEPAHRWFGNSFSVGLTVDVIRIAARRGKALGGRAGYFLAAIEAVAGHSTASYRLTIDGESIEARTAEAKRNAYAATAARWDGPEAGARYERFCRENKIDGSAVHRKHAISWDMLETLRSDPLVEIGSHTVSHARISSLSPQDAFAELHDSRERLRAKLGVAARHFAFPYGRSGDCGQRDFDIAREAGYSSTATTRKGIVRAGQDPYCLPRNTLNGAHRNLTMIELHLTGVTGAAARVLGRV